MGKPNVPSKQTGDLFTADEFNEVVSSINDNDDKVTQTKTTVTTQGQELAQKPYRAEVILKTDNPTGTNFLSKIAFGETPSAGDILKFNGINWQEEKPTPTLNITAYSKAGNFGGLEKANINYIFIADGQVVIEPIDFPPEKGMILIAKNDNKNPSKVLTLEVPAGYKINGKSSDTVPGDGVESIYAYDDSTKNWIKTSSQTVVTELGGYTGIINDQLLDSIVSGIGFTKTPLTTYIDEKGDSVSSIDTVKVIGASVAQDSGNTSQVNVTIPSGITVKDKDGTSYDRTQEVQFLGTGVDVTAPTLSEPLKITINKGGGSIDKIELKTRYAELSQAAGLPVDENILVLRYQGTADINQPLPNLNNVADGTFIIVENLAVDRDHGVTFTPATPSQNINGEDEFSVNSQSGTYTLIADKGSNEWHVIQDKKAYNTILDKDDNEFSYYEKIKFAGASIKQPINPNEPIEVDYSGTATEVTFKSLDKAMQPKSNIYKGNTITAEYPLAFYNDSQSNNSVLVRVEPAAFERTHTPSYYATMNDEVELTGLDSNGVRTGLLWMDDVIEPGGLYIEIDRDNKAIGLQEDDMGDPNITGGTAYLIHLRVAFKGVAPEDGFIELFLRDKLTKKIINDWNGEPIGVKKQYKQDDEFGVLELSAIKKFKGIEEFQMVVEHSSFEDYIVIEDRTEGNTCIMIQALHKDEKTGFGLLQMENDLMANLEFTSHYMGDYMFTLRSYLLEEHSVKEGNAGDGTTGADGWHLYNSTKLKAGVQGGRFILEDNGTDMAYFSFGKVLSAEKTQLLRNKTIKFTINCATPNAGFNVYGAKWSGVPDKYTKEIITGENNGTPIVQANWTLLPNPLFISESIAGSLNTFTKEFTVPEDAENFAIILVPVGEQSPMKIEIATFQGDVKDPFNGYFIKGMERIDEQHLKRSIKYKEFGLNTEGYASLRYTINQTELPMPAGKSIKGSADVSGNWNSLGGAVDFLTFNVDGTAKISTTYNVYPGESLPADGSTLVTFWWTYESSPDTWVKIPASERSFTINKNEKGAVTFTIPEFEYIVAPGTKLRAYAKAGINDGAYIETTSPHVYLCQTEVEFDEIN